MSEKTNKIEAVPAKAKADHPLVGRCFHIMATRSCGCRIVTRQGIVRGVVDDERYLVQWFDWLMGEPNFMKIVRIDQMTDWRFYEDDEAMVFAWKYRSLKDRQDEHIEHCDADRDADHAQDAAWD